MAANTTPYYVKTPFTGWAKVTDADTSTDGTDADVQLVCTAGADAAFLQKIILQPISTSGSTTTSAAAARFYLNNGSTVATGTNNILFAELTLAAVAVNTGATVAAYRLEFPINFQLPAGYRVYVGITAMAANTQWNVLPIGGSY